MMNFTQDQIIEMRNWINECIWADLEPDQIDELTDREVLNGVEVHYHGGVSQFIKDGE